MKICMQLIQKPDCVSVIAALRCIEIHETLLTLEAKHELMYVMLMTHNQFCMLCQALLCDAL